MDRKSLASAAETNQTPITNRAVRECSRTFQEQTKKRFEEVLEDVATATRTFVCGKVGVLHPGGGDGDGGGGEGVGGREELEWGREAAKCSREWREEGNKRWGFGGKGEGGVAGRGLARTSSGPRCCGLMKHEWAEILWAVIGPL